MGRVNDMVLHQQEQDVNNGMVLMDEMNRIMEDFYENESDPRFPEFVEGHESNDEPVF